MTEVKEVEAMALTVPEKARAIKVIDNETYTQAGAILVEIKGLRKEINSVFNPIIDKANQAHKEAVAQKRKAEAPLAEAESIIKPALAAYDTAQERIRREAEQAAQEAARKVEEERKLKEAVALEQSGKKDEAERVMAEPVYVPPVVIPKTVPKMQGVSYKEVWRYRITDADKIPRSYLMPDEVRIGQVVRALKSACNIPGVEVYAEKIVAGRG